MIDQLLHSITTSVDNNDNFTLTSHPSGAQILCHSSGERVFDYRPLLATSEGETLLRNYYTWRIAHSIEGGKDISSEKLDQVVDRLINAWKQFIQSPEEFYRQVEKEQFLFYPALLLLTLGGDDRIVVNSRLINKYNTSVIPQYDTSLSSCTSSSSSAEALAFTEDRHFELLGHYIVGTLDAGREYQALRQDMREKWEMPELQSEQMVLTPSGTDLEYWGTYLGLARSRELWPDKEERETFVIVTASDEVGSGTALACAYEHISDLLPTGDPVEKGQAFRPQEGMKVFTETFNCRNQEGDPIDPDELEREMEKILEREIQENQRTVVLHWIHSSKTGICVPSKAFVQKAREKYGPALILIADMAQFRIHYSHLSDYLENNYNLILTGSKFVGGAPFSGAFVLNPQDFKTLQETPLPTPAEFDQYFSRYTLAPGSEINFETSWINWGMFIRWRMAMFEYGRFRGVPENICDQIVQNWGELCAREIETRDNFSAVPHEEEHRPEDNSNISQTNSIATFVIDTKIHAPKDEMKKFHRQLTQRLDASEEEKAEGDTEVLGQKLEIGQPVLVNEGAPKTHALRMALGARNIVEIYRDFKASDRQLDQVVKEHFQEAQNVFDKIEHLLTNNL